MSSFIPFVSSSPPPLDDTDKHIDNDDNDDDFGGFSSAPPPPAIGRSDSSKGFTQVHSPVDNTTHDFPSFPIQTAPDSTDLFRPIQFPDNRTDDRLEDEFQARKESSTGSYQINPVDNIFTNSVHNSIQSPQNVESPVISGSAMFEDDISEDDDWSGFDRAPFAEKDSFDRAPVAEKDTFDRTPVAEKDNFSAGADIGTTKIFYTHQRNDSFPIVYQTTESVKDKVGVNLSDDFNKSVINSFETNAETESVANSDSLKSIENIEFCEKAQSSEISTPSSCDTDFGKENSFKNTVSSENAAIEMAVGRLENFDTIKSVHADSTDEIDPSSYSRPGVREKQEEDDFYAFEQIPKTNKDDDLDFDFKIRQKSCVQEDFDDVDEDENEKKQSDEKVFVTNNEIESHELGETIYHANEVPTSKEYNEFASFDSFQEPEASVDSVAPARECVVTEKTGLADGEISGLDEFESSNAFNKVTDRSQVYDIVDDSNNSTEWSTKVVNADVENTLKSEARLDSDIEARDEMLQDTTLTMEEIIKEILKKKCDVDAKTDSMCVEAEDLESGSLSSDVNDFKLAAAINDDVDDFKSDSDEKLQDTLSIEEIIKEILKKKCDVDVKTDSMSVEAEDLESGSLSSDANDLKLGAAINDDVDDFKSDSDEKLQDTLSMDEIVKEMLKKKCDVDTKTDSMCVEGEDLESGSLSSDMNELKLGQIGDDGDDFEFGSVEAEVEIFRDAAIDDAGYDSKAWAMDDKEGGVLESSLIDNKGVTLKSTSIDNKPDYSRFKSQREAADLKSSSLGDKVDDFQTSFVGDLNLDSKLDEADDDFDDFDDFQACTVPENNGTKIEETASKPVIEAEDWSAFGTTEETEEDDDWAAFGEPVAPSVVPPTMKLNAGEGLGSSSGGLVQAPAIGSTGHLLSRLKVSW